MHKKQLRTLIFTSALAIGLASTSTVYATDEYPSDTIRIVSVWPAGGAHDIAARLIAQQLSENLSVSVVVDNVTGAGGSTGMRYIQQADPDGYTIGVMGMHAVAQSYMNPNATRLEDIDPLVYFGEDPGALQVSADSGITSLSEYVDKVKENPSSVINGNDAQGGNSFVFAELLDRALGVNTLKIPYRGHAPSVTALVSNEVQSATLPVPPVIEHHRAENINILAVMSEDRHPLLPNVPTFIEEGYELVANDFYMIVAPIGIPREVKSSLADALYDVVSSEKFTSAASSTGMVVRPERGEETKKLLENQAELIYPLLYDAGLVHQSLEITN